MSTTITVNGVTISGPADEVQKFTEQQYGYNPLTQYKTRTCDKEYDIVYDIVDMSISHIFNSMLTIIIEHLSSLQSYIVDVDDVDDVDDVHDVHGVQRHKAITQLDNIVDLFGFSNHCSDTAFVTLRTELEKRGTI